MTLPAFAPLQRPTAGHPRQSRRAGRLGLIAFGLAALATVAAGSAALALGAAATVMLAIAAASAMRLRWHAAEPAEPRAVVDTAPEAVAVDDLTVQLRRLHDAHLEEMNLALNEGREDLARELADSYTDQALAMLTRG